MGCNRHDRGATVLMSDERLRLAIPDDQVCAACQAVVMNYDKHQAWHLAVNRHINVRIERVARHMRANAQQAADLVGIEQRDREADVTRIDARIDGLNAAFIHQRDHPDLDDVPEFDPPVPDLVYQDGIYHLADGTMRHLTTGELPDGTYSIQGGRVVNIVQTTHMDAEQ